MLFYGYMPNPLSNTFSYNDDLRHAERRRVFKVDELSRLAAEAVNRSSDDIVRMHKLAEGGFNRTFLITMRGGFRMVARIPYPMMIPKYLAIASEVATMALLRSFGLPIPEVYGYSPTPNNAAGTEYIFMEYVQGTNLSDIWFDLGEGEIISISRQIAELESKMMSIAFPAGGSLYYTEDLKNAAGVLIGLLGRASHLRTTVSASARIQVCVYGMGEDHCSTWIEDHVGPSLYFSILL